MSLNDSGFDADSLILQFWYETIPDSNSFLGGQKLSRFKRATL